MTENYTIKIEIPLTSDYTKISNKIINDKRLSGNARTLLAHMLSNSTKWKYTVNGLVQGTGFGIDAVQSALKELEEYYYVKRIRLYPSKKWRRKRIKYVYIIFSLPKEVILEKHSDILINKYPEVYEYLIKESYQEKQDTNQEYLAGDNYKNMGIAESKPKQRKNKKILSLSNNIIDKKVCQEEILEKNKNLCDDMIFSTDNQWGGLQSIVNPSQTNTNITNTNITINNIKKKDKRRNVNANNITYTDEIYQEKNIENFSSSSNKKINKQSKKQTDKTEIIVTPEMRKEVKEMFNNTCIDLIKVEEIDEPRARLIAKVYKKEYGLKYFQEVFTKVQKSDFLCGRLDKKYSKKRDEEKQNFRADFDWILNTKHFLRIHEGCYDNWEKENTKTKKHKPSFDMEAYDNYSIFDDYKDEEEQHKPSYNIQEYESHDICDDEEEFKRHIAQLKSGKDAEEAEKGEGEKQENQEDIWDKYDKILLDMESQDDIQNDKLPENAQITQTLVEEKVNEANEDELVLNETLYDMAYETENNNVETYASQSVSAEFDEQKYEQKDEPKFEESHNDIENINLYAKTDNLHIANLGNLGNFTNNKQNDKSCKRTYNPKVYFEMNYNVSSSYTTKYANDSNFYQNSMCKIKNKDYLEEYDKMLMSIKPQTPLEQSTKLLL